jgi:hypothetical protein
MVHQFQNDLPRICQHGSLIPEWSPQKLSAWLTNSRMISPKAVSMAHWFQNDLPKSCKHGSPIPEWSPQKLSAWLTDSRMISLYGSTSYHVVGKMEGREPGSLCLVDITLCRTGKKCKLCVYSGDTRQTWKAMVLFLHLYLVYILCSVLVHPQLSKNNLKEIQVFLLSIPKLRSHFSFQLTLYCPTLFLQQTHNKRWQAEHVLS